MTLGISRGGRQKYALGKNQTKIKPGAGEVDQQVKALAALPDDQRSINPQDICGKERTECAKLAPDFSMHAVASRRPYRILIPLCLKGKT